MNAESQPHPDNSMPAQSVAERRKMFGIGAGTVIAGALVAQSIIGITNANADRQPDLSERAQDVSEHIDPHKFDLKVGTTDSQLADALVDLREAQLVGNLTPNYFIELDKWLIAGELSSGPEFFHAQAVAHVDRFADAHFVPGWESNENLKQLVEMAVNQNEDIAMGYFGEERPGFDLVLEKATVLQKDDEKLILDLTTRVEYSGAVLDRFGGHQPEEHRRVVTLVPEDGDTLEQPERYLIADWTELASTLGN